jgi:hypothetical protein
MNGPRGSMYIYSKRQYNEEGLDGYVPLFEVFTEVAVNPGIVAGWTFPGVTSEGIGHWHLIEAAN